MSGESKSDFNYPFGVFHAANELRRMYSGDASEDDVYVISKLVALEYGKWLIENCIIAREGFRIGTSNWSEVISNEDAYERYLESLKSK